MGGRYSSTVFAAGRCKDRPAPLHRSKFGIQIGHVLTSAVFLRRFPANYPRLRTAEIFLPFLCSTGSQTWYMARAVEVIWRVAWSTRVIGLDVGLGRTDGARVGSLDVDMFPSSTKVLTRDDWVNVMWNCMYYVHPVAVLYFLFLVILGDFLLLNLFLAILIKYFDHEEIKKYAAALSFCCRSLCCHTIASGPH